MPPEKLRAVVFDIGRVLIRVDIARATGGLAAGLTLSPAEVWSAIQNDPHWPDWQEGRISPRDWHAHLSKRLGTSVPFERFAEIWNQALDPHPLLDDAFLVRLAKRYRMGLLSNTDPIHVAHLEANFDFVTHFPVRIYSCAIGVCKPDPLIYREALRGLRVRAEEAVYVDDVAAYVDAARRLGMKAVHFQTATQLVQEFRELGID